MPAGYWPCSQGKVEKPNLTRISLNVESSRYANVCAVYLLVCQFVTDISTKFTSDCIASLSAMVQPERPHINVHCKMDLVTSKKDINKHLNSKPRLLIDLNQYMVPQFQKLNTCLMELVHISWLAFCLSA